MNPKRYIVELEPPLSEEFIDYILTIYDVPERKDITINLPLDNLLLDIKDESIKHKFKTDLEYLKKIAKEGVNYLEWIFN